jgi:hypothetical protein
MLSRAEQLKKSKIFHIGRSPQGFTLTFAKVWLWQLAMAVGHW